MEHDSGRWLQRVMSPRPSGMQSNRVLPPMHSAGVVHPGASSSGGCGASSSTMQLAVQPQSPPVMQMVPRLPGVQSGAAWWCQVCSDPIIGPSGVQCVSCGDWVHPHCGQRGATRDNGTVCFICLELFQIDTQRQQLLQTGELAAYIGRVSQHGASITGAV